MRGKRTKFNFTRTARELSSILFLCITKTKITALPPSKHALKLSDIGTTLLSSNLPLVVFLFYTGIPLPLNWCVQPKESSGNEKEVHLVELDATSNEYNKVAEGIRKTASISITKIERVQTPGLYKAYAVKKEQMEQKNSHGANEKLLFHGTAEVSCSSISTFGFNRSYCAKNGKSSINQSVNQLKPLFKHHEG